MGKLILLLLFIIPISFVSLDFTGINTPVSAKPTISNNIVSENCTYWITKSSRKRHNDKCRWYKNSKGYCSEDKEEGTACKVCGG